MHDTSARRCRRTCKPEVENSRLGSDEVHSADRTGDAGGHPTRGRPGSACTPLSCLALAVMASWDEVVVEAPDLAGRVRGRFGASKHNLVATLRRDGSPRISGVEVQHSGGHLWVGMMGGSRKAADLQRDPRLALHSAPIDLEMGDGDAKIGGRADEVVDEAEIAAWLGDLGSQPPGTFHLFRIDVTEMSVVRVAVDRLVIDAWQPGRGAWQVERT